MLREGGVVIGVVPSAGVIDGERCPTFGDAIRLYAEAGSVAALAAHERDYVRRPHGAGFHPAHPFWLFYEAEYLLARAGRVVFAGAAPSPLTRALGVEVARDFDAAWAMARETVGPTPRVVVAPRYWTRPRVKFVVDA